MKLSTKGRYGTRLLLDLALQEGKEPVLLKDIAKRQQIPLPYLKHLVTRLVASGLLHSSRGVNGGVSLARSPGQIKLDEVIQFLEGPISMVECVDHPERCKRSPSCATRDVWAKVGNAMKGVLESTTLQDLSEMQKAKEPAKAEMYYI
jgi:Rrf2 family protein